MMPQSSFFRELRRAIVTETESHPGGVVKNLGVFSQSREIGRFYLDCLYTGENIVDFEWQDETGQSRHDYKIADVCVYLGKQADILPEKLELHQFSLLASGVIVESYEGVKQEVDATSVGFLLGLLCRKEES